MSHLISRQAREVLKKSRQHNQFKQVLNYQKSDVNSYKDIYASLLYTDNSIKTLSNPIQSEKTPFFVITGDHTHRSKR
jgi:hypothetical protein